MARAPIAETIRILKQDTEALTKELIVSTAKREHARIMSAEPRPSSFVRIVDGSVGAPEERVKPAGVIVYQYQRIAEIVQFAMETLYDLSPVLSGDYRNSHQIMLNGRPVNNLSDWKQGDEVSITNTLPYSRKIEIGKMKMRVSGTSKVYQQARQKIMARFGNIVSVEFTYRAVIAGHGVDQAKTATRKRKATGDFEKTLKRGAHNQSDRRFPVIVITER